MARPKAFDEEVVLEKAMELFWKKGYFDTSIKDLIDYLGISNASIYNTFGGKQELFHRALEHYQTINLKGMRGFLATQDNIRQGLTEVFAKIIYDDVKDEDCKGCFVVNSTTQLAPTDPVVLKAISNHKLGVEQAFREFLQKGVDTGQISEAKDIGQFAGLLYSLMTGFRVLGMANPDPDSFMAYVQSVLSLLD